MAVKIRTTTKRPIEDKKNESPVYSIDNRRGVGFLSYLHKPRQIVTADELWQKLIDKVKFQKDLAEILERSKKIAKSAFNSVSPNYPKHRIRIIGDDVKESYFRSPRFTYRRLDTFEPEIEQLVFKEDNDWWDSLKKYFTENTFPKLNSDLIPLNIDWNFSLNKKPKIESEEEFHERSRWQLRNTSEDLPEGWRELQESLEPHLACEDCLGSFYEWVERTPDNAQYVLIGDTHHYNKDLAEWRDGGVYIPALQNAGIKHLVLELPYELEPALEQFFADSQASTDYLANEFLKLCPTMGNKVIKIAELCASARKAGIVVHALDAQITQNLDQKSPRFFFERLAHDSKLARKIKDKVGHEKTAILYGNTHFGYESTLVDQLGANNCRMIDVFSSLKDFYECQTKHRNAKYVSPYAYIIEEATVIATSGNYHRSVSPNKDEANAGIQMGLQEAEVIKFRERFDAIHGTDGAPNLYGVTGEDILKDVLWHQKALRTGFTKTP